MRYDSYLVTYFRDFHIELIHLKQLIQSGREKLIDSENTEEDKEPEEISGYVRSRLLTKMEELSANTGQSRGEFSIHVYRDTQYIMAALADEVFLNEDWEEKEVWKANLLEYKIFGSKIAGEEIFNRIDKLLEERDASSMELAFIYLLALFNGFQGKYRYTGREIEIRNYSTQLYIFIFQKKPGLLKNGKHIFPETHEYTLAEGIGYKIPYLKKWYIIIAALCGSLFIISHVLWRLVVSDLDAVVEKVLHL